MKGIKKVVCTGAGMFGSVIAHLCGGWDSPMITLIVFMAVDYFSGLVVAGVFKQSPKSASGALESLAGWKGLCRKGVTLLIVMVAYRLDMLVGVDYIRNAVVIGFCANELISIMENAGLMGIPMPGPIKKAIEVLAQKAENE